jgi:hypothetical protein
VTDDDQNYQKYLQLASNAEWRMKHASDFVAIINGEVLGYDNNSDRLFEQVDLRFPHQAFFFTQVTLADEDDAFDIPSILSENI